MQDVGAACGAKGDLAPEQGTRGAGDGSGRNDTDVRVWVVGQMLKYTYAQSCARDRYVTPSFPPSLPSSLPSATTSSTQLLTNQDQQEKEEPH